MLDAIMHMFPMSSAIYNPNCCCHNHHSNNGSNYSNNNNYTKREQLVDHSMRLPAMLIQFSTLYLIKWYCFLYSSYSPAAAVTRKKPKTIVVVAILEV